MTAVLYILTSILLGRLLLAPFARLEGESVGRSLKLMVYLPAAWAAGTVAMTWAVYGISYILHTRRGMAQPLGAADAVVTTGSLALVFLAELIRLIRKKPDPWRGFLREASGNPRLFTAELVLGIAVFLFVFLTLTHTCRISGDGDLHLGFTVFSDMSPHTAMMRSFSKGANYPTQYPHYGGEDVKYHFLFQFLAGNLEYLGLPLDLAINIPTTLGFTGFMMILANLAARLFNRFSAGILAVVFVIFRSGLAFFLAFYEGIRNGTLSKVLEASEFLGFTPNENWGLWNFNVYLNQRHLAFALLPAAFLIWYFLEALETGCRKEDRGTAWPAGQFFTFSAWKSRGICAAITGGILLGALAFWNGAVVIGLLIILFGMAIFSDAKTDYLIAAVVTVLLSFLQTRFFIRGNAMSPAFVWGFIAEDRSLAGVLWFMLEVTGVTLAGLLILVWFLSRTEKALAAAFILPVLFALCASLTPDVTVNHKYIMISCDLCAILWGGAVSGLLAGKWLRRMAAVFLTFGLTATGIYDYITVLHMNGEGRELLIDTKSDVTEWLVANTSSEDLFLTPWYTVNEITLSGRMMYCGWPYYAWSAGYDTDSRGSLMKLIYTEEDPDTLRSLVEDAGVDYIVYEDGETMDELALQEGTIEEVFEQVYASDNGWLRIYRVD